MGIVEHELEPVYDAYSKVLILGTIPSPKSREVGFYYSHPQNRFWKVMSTLCSEDVPHTTEEKKVFVLKHGIALWDVLCSCEIDRASDSSIKKPIVNDISMILRHTDIAVIVTTGKKAHELYMKYCYPQTGVKDICLSSTSPANCQKSLADLVQEYSIIYPYLRDC